MMELHVPNTLCLCTCGYANYHRQDTWEFTLNQGIHSIQVDEIPQYAGLTATIRHTIDGISMDLTDDYWHESLGMSNHPISLLAINCVKQGKADYFASDKISFGNLKIHDQSHTTIHDLVGIKLKDGIAVYDKITKRVFEVQNGTLYEG